MSYTVSQNSRMKNSSSLVTLLFVISVLCAMPAGEARAALFPDGVLLRPAGGFRVYYIEKNVKRLIESATAFIVQGFNWNSVQVVPPDTLVNYRDGGILTAVSNVIMPGEEEFLPDLMPFPAKDLRLTKLNGRTVLKFTSNFWNGGRGAIELIPDPKTTAVPGDVTTAVYQHIRRTDASYRDKLVGNFLWHAPHNHYHFENFANYRFEAMPPTPSTPVVQEKTSRCLWDTDPINLDLPGAPRQKVFTACENRERQGISVGWGDIYNYTLADQYLDVHDLPPGFYHLIFEVDPLSVFTETRKDNNRSVAVLYLDVAHGVVRTLAAAGPFASSANFFPDGMLVQSENDEKIYVTHSNKKRWIRTEELFNSYGYIWSDIRELPRGTVDAIPYNNLVRADGITVYALNDAGYRRHLRTAEVFSSYGFLWEDIADIAENEFDLYPEARLVRPADSQNVYYLEDGTTLRHIRNPGVFTENGFSWDEVHVINQTDFSSYSIGSEITTKSIAP